MMVLVAEDSPCTVRYCRAKLLPPPPPPPPPPPSQRQRPQRQLENDPSTQFPRFCFQFLAEQERAVPFGSNDNTSNASTASTTATPDLCTSRTHIVTGLTAGRLEQCIFQGSTTSIRPDTSLMADSTELAELPPPPAVWKFHNVCRKPKHLQSIANILPR